MNKVTFLLLPFFLTIACTENAPNRQLINTNNNSDSNAGQTPLGGTSGGVPGAGGNTRVASQNPSPSPKAAPSPAKSTESDPAPATQPQVDSESARVPSSSSTSPIVPQSATSDTNDIVSSIGSFASAIKNVTGAGNKTTTTGSGAGSPPTGAQSAGGVGSIVASVPTVVVDTDTNENCWLSASSSIDLDATSFTAFRSAGAGTYVDLTFTRSDCFGVVHGTIFVDHFKAK